MSIFVEKSYTSVWSPMIGSNPFFRSVLGDLLQLETRKAASLAPCESGLIHSSQIIRSIVLVCQSLQLKVTLINTLMGFYLKQKINIIEIQI